MYSISWIVTGDLNVIVEDFEKFRGMEIWGRKIFLRSLINGCGD